MTNTAVIAEARDLVAQYEVLRRDVIDSGRNTVSVRGLALLMRQGMASWMRCVSEQPIRSPSVTAGLHGERVPVGIDVQLVDILAAMTLATAAEGMLL